MPVAGPYLPYYPPVYPGIVPYTPGPFIYPTTAPVQPWPRDVYIGDPPPGWSTVTVSMNNTLITN